MPFFGLFGGCSLNAEAQGVVEKFENKFGDFNLAFNFAIINKDPRDPGATLYFQNFNSDLL